MTEIKFRGEINKEGEWGKQLKKHKSNQLILESKSISDIKEFI